MQIDQDQLNSDLWRWTQYLCLNQMVFKDVISRYSDDSLRGSWQFFESCFQIARLSVHLKQGEITSNNCELWTCFSYFKDILKSEIAASEWFPISFDESLNKAVQDREMDFVTRFLKNAANKVNF